jgi:Ser/Thr protein kinase RdoA (MazF antagonist)
MHALAEAGIDAPDLLPTRDGDVVARVTHPDVPGPRQCDLMTWVEGRPLGSLEHGVDLDAEALRAEYRTVGAIAARIEDHGATWVRPEGFARPSWDAEALVGDAPTFGAFWELPELEPEQRALLLRARDHVREDLAALGPAETLVHGDLIPDNLLVAEGTVRVIDFDDCGFSWPVLELVTSVFPLLVTGGFEAGLQGYLEGYRSVRRFPETELGHVPTVLLARGLSYLGWPVGRPEIHSQRAMVPLIARGLCDFARQLLDGPR